MYTYSKYCTLYSIWFLLYNQCKIYILRRLCRDTSDVVIFYTDCRNQKTLKKQHKMLFLFIILEPTYKILQISAQSPKTGFLHSRSGVVKTRVLVTFDPLSKAKETIIKHIFTIFYGLSEKCKALYSVNCIYWCQQIILSICFAQCVKLGQELHGPFTQSLSTAESIATLPPFGPIEGHKWFEQIRSQ